MDIAYGDSGGGGARAAARRAFGTTPRRLTLLTAALAVLGVLLGVVYALGLRTDTSSFDGLRARTTEVSATSDLYDQLNDMDAQAANALLVGRSSDAVYDSDRSAADADLARIAGNPQLRIQAERLLDELGAYEAEIAQALYANQKPVYIRASALLHSTLLPMSLRIADADSSAVDASYSGEHADITLYGYAVLVLALLAAVALLLGNRFHARRFRRRVSWLAPGIVVCVTLGFVGLSTQLGAADHLHYAKRDAYDSINALMRAKAVSNDANGDESRWLLEGRAPALQTSYFEKASAVAGVPGVSREGAGVDPQAYYAGLSTATGALRLDAADNSVAGVTLSGYLGTELHNLTFPGEAKAADAATVAFDTYIQADATIRSDVTNGNVTGAVAFDVGTEPGQSDYAFTQYMAKLEAVIQINDSAFDSGISAGLGEGGGASWALMIIGELLLLVFVAQAGRLRLREYR